MSGGDDPGGWRVVPGVLPAEAAERYRLLPEPVPWGAEVFVAHMRFLDEGWRLPSSLQEFFQFYEDRVADDVVLGRMLAEKMGSCGGWVEYPQWCRGATQARLFNSLREAYEGELVAVGEEEWVKKDGCIPAICSGGFISNKLGHDLMAQRSGMIPTAVINGHRFRLSTRFIIDCVAEVMNDVMQDVVRLAFVVKAVFRSMRCFFLFLR